MLDLKSWTFVRPNCKKILTFIRRWNFIFLAPYNKGKLSIRCLHWKKKWSHFDLISWVTGGTKIWHGIPSNWRIFESNSLIIKFQFDSNILKLLGIPGKFLVQWLNFLGQNDTIFSFSVWEAVRCAIYCYSLCVGNFGIQKKLCYTGDAILCAKLFGFHSNCSEQEVYTNRRSTKRYLKLLLFVRTKNVIAWIKIDLWYIN